MAMAACGLIADDSPVAVSTPAPTAGAGVSAAPGGGPAAALSLEADAIVAAQEEVLSSIYDAVLPSVVTIQVQQRVSPQQPDFRSQPPFGLPSPDGPGEILRGEGSGFVWDDQDHIVTNHHVVQGADRVKVVFSDGAEFDAEVVGTDPDSDLAVLKVDARSRQLRPVQLGDSNAL